MNRRFTSFLYSCLSPLLVLFMLTSWGCQSSNQQQGSQSSVRADTVRFSHQVQANYAEGFRISYHKNYKLLEILQPFQDQVDTLRYSLVPREIAGEVEVVNTEEIPIPVRSLIATSTTHVGLTEMLNINDIITGMVEAEYVYSAQVRKRLKNGKITSFGSGEFNKEQALALQPDLLMISGGQSSQLDNYQVLMDSGIDVMVNSEWLETTPLGKAEWVKVMAALVNKEEVANKEFSAVADKYNSLKAAADTINQKPLVINNMPYKGVWFISGGESFTAQYLKDAGADYPWYSSSETGGLRKDLEAVYEKGLNADIWLNPGTAKSLEEVLAKDARFGDFKAYEQGEVYNNNRRVNKSGGNDFWESGVVHPEILLADLIKIFHPQLVPNHNLHYYQQLD